MVSRLKRFRSWIIGAAAGFSLVSGLALASTWFNYFGPVNGILYGSAASPQTRAAAAGDVESLWTGTCSSTTYLRGDGQCATPPGTGGGTVNSVGLTMPTGFAVANSPVTNSGTLAVTTTLSGVLLGTGSGFSTAAASDIVGLFSTCSGTQYLGADGSCHSAGAGTVTSVGLSAPSVFAVGSSPVTGSGTLALTFATGQTANEFLATPDGSSGAIGLRAIASGDIPTVLNSVTSASSLATVGTIGTGVWQGTAVGAAYGGSGEAGTITGVLKANGSSAYTAAAYGDVTGLWSGTCSSSTYLRGDGQCVTPTGGAGTVTSVGLSDSSTTAIFTIGSSPVTTSGTLTETLNTQSANAIFAGPTSGSAAQPNFRAMVAADLPLSSSPTWTGNHTFTPGSGSAITINGAAGSYAALINGGATSGSSYGLEIEAGTTSSDAAFRVKNQAATKNYFAVTGDGQTEIADSAGNLFDAGYLGVPTGSTCSSGCTLALSDRGKVVAVTTGQTATLPENVFATGDVISLAILSGGGTITVAQGAGVTLFWGNGTSTSGNRTVTGIAIVTVYWDTPTVAIISGPGIS